MSMRITIAMIALVTLLSACTATEAQLDAHATRVVAEIYASLDGDTPGPRPADTLTPAEIYARIAPSIVYIEEEYGGTGSGFLVQGRGENEGNIYVVTNMHVVWPGGNARIVFPDGGEYLDVPLVGWDLMLDLAVLGPIDTDKAVAPLGDGEDLAVGSDVYLIGYPHEWQQFPQPALVHGLISRRRQRTESGLTYFQTDAPALGGQSGGVMVAADGSVIGVTGSVFGEVFALAMSMPDIEGAIYGLIAGDDVDGLSARMLPTRARWRQPRVELEHLYDTRMFVLDGESGTELVVSGESENDIRLSLVDMLGEYVATADDTLEGRETLSITVPYAEPMFLIVDQFTASPGDVRFESSAKLAPFDDADDGKVIEPGARVAGNIDYPTDIDAFLIDLKAGHPISVTVHSELFDPELSIGALDAPVDEYAYDDDSGGGPFGDSPFLAFTPAADGPHLVVIDAVESERVGGYVVVVEGVE